MHLAVISITYGSVCVCLCVCCFLGDGWEVVGKSNVRVTEHVSSRHNPPNREPLVFYREGGVQGLVGDENNHQTVMNPLIKIWKICLQ